MTEGSSQSMSPKAGREGAARGVIARYIIEEGLSFEDDKLIDTAHFSAWLAAINYWSKGQKRNLRSDVMLYLGRPLPPPPHSAPLGSPNIYPTPSLDSYNATVESFRRAIAAAGSYPDRKTHNQMALSIFMTISITGLRFPQLARSVIIDAAPDVSPPDRLIIHTTPPENSDRVLKTKLTNLTTSEHKLVTRTIVTLGSLMSATDASHPMEKRSYIKKMRHKLNIDKTINKHNLVPHVRISDLRTAYSKILGKVEYQGY